MYSRFHHSNQSSYKWFDKNSLGGCGKFYRCLEYEQLLIVISYVSFHSSYPDVVQPTITLANPLRITLPVTTTNRAYPVPISITGANSATVTVRRNDTLLNTITLNNLLNTSFSIDIPNNGNSYLDVQWVLFRANDPTHHQSLKSDCHLRCEFNHNSATEYHCLFMRKRWHM